MTSGQRATTSVREGLKVVHFKGIRLGTMFDICWTVHHCDNWRITTHRITNPLMKHATHKRTLRSPRIKDHNY